jgi:hypothetical protein
MTTPPDPTEREGTGRRMTRGREAPPGERLGKLGQHPPPWWKNAGSTPIGGRGEMPSVIGRGGGPGSRRKYGLRRREGGGAGAEPVWQETRERVDAGE